eukprot:2210585-Rhodomonas_salina.1
MPYVSTVAPRADVRRQTTRQYRAPCRNYASCTAKTSEFPAPIVTGNPSFAFDFGASKAGISRFAFDFGASNRPELSLRCSVAEHAVLVALPLVHLRPAPPSTLLLTSSSRPLVQKMCA